MTPFVIVTRYFWLIAIAVSIANGLIWWRRAQPVMAKHPERAAGYRRLITGWIVFGCIPWIVMGIGVMFGGVPDIFHFFNPRNGPFVVAWYVSLAGIWLLLTWWVFFRGGAEKLAAHPGLFRGSDLSPGAVKALCVLSLVIGVVVLAVLSFGNVSAPVK